jgi:putative membrane protein
MTGRMNTLASVVAALFVAAQVSPVVAQEDESVVDQVTDAVTPAVNDPAEFATMAASSNMFEIESSRLALERSQASEIQSFAQQMIDDHTAAGEKMKQAAQEAGVEVPTTMADAEQEQLEELQQSETFDEDYLDAQVDAHDKAVDLFEGFSENAEDGPLRSFAQETLPTLQEHQTRVNELTNS